MNLLALSTCFCDPGKRWFLPIIRFSSGILFGCILLLSVIAWGQSCEPCSKKYPDLIATLPKNANGVTIVNYAVQGTASADVVAAFNAWNQQSGSTNVQFVQVDPDSGTADINVLSGTSADLCAETNVAGGRITYGPQLSNAISTNPTLTNLVFQHEIGHLLGLADNVGNNGDIMDQSVHCPGTPSGYSWDVYPPANGGAQVTHPSTGGDAQQVGKCQNKFTKCLNKK